MEGRCIVFDDSFLHSAWNDSDESRCVLVFDFFHPDLTAPEVDYLASLVERWRLAKPYSGVAAGGAGSTTLTTREAAGAPHPPSSG